MKKIPIFGIDLQHSFVSEEEIKLPLKVRYISEKYQQNYVVCQPVIDEHRIYHTYLLYKPLRSGLCAYDRMTGKRLWDFLFGDGGSGLQVFAEKGRVYYSASGHIGCVDGSSGNILWKMQPKDWESRGVSEGGINIDFLCEGVLLVPFESALNAIDAEDGSILWKIDNGPCGPPSLYKGRLYFSNAGLDPNYLYCYDLATKKTLWKSNLSELGRYIEDGKTHMGSGGGVTTIYQDRAFVVLPKSIAAFNTETGEPLWQILGYFNVQPVSDGKRLYIFCGERLTAYDVETGEMVYQTKNVPDAKRIFGGGGDCLLTANGILIAGGGNRLFAFDTVTGEIVWEFWNKKKEGGMVLQPILYEGLLYVIDRASHLYCFESAEP